MSACSTRCRRAPRICANRCSSRLRLLTFSKSSAARLSICRQFCKPLLNRLHGSAMPRTLSLHVKKRGPFTAPRPTGTLLHAIISEIKDRHIHIGDTVVGEAVQRRIPIQIPDIQNDPNPAVFDVIVRAGFRALLIVPLLGADRTVGALVVRRKQPGEFPKHTVDLLQTFAAQSVLAIQNARLFENVEARTRELAKSLEELRTAQDRLVQTQKLASLGQ